MKPVTIADKPRNNQDVFNRCWDTFVVEKQPQCRGMNWCLYRSEDGKWGCAVGCCITDEMAKLSDSHADSNIACLLDEIDEFTDWFEFVDRDFLTSIQHVHDHANKQTNETRNYSDVMQFTLQDVAREYKLTVPE